MWLFDLKLGTAYLNPPFSVQNKILSFLNIFKQQNNLWRNVLDQTKVLEVKVNFICYSLSYCYKKFCICILMKRDMFTGLFSWLADTVWRSCLWDYRGAVHWKRRIKCWDAAGIHKMPRITPPLTEEHLFPTSQLEINHNLNLLDNSTLK